MKPGQEDREIAEDHDSRPLPPEDVFSFPLVDRWRNRFWRMVGDVVTEDVTAEFVRNPPEYVVSDDLGGLDEIVMRVTGTAVDMKEIVASRLVRDYRAFRAAHGTRTDDVGQFYKGGLRTLRAGEVEDRARADRRAAVRALSTSAPMSEASLPGLAAAATTSSTAASTSFVLVLGSSTGGMRSGHSSRSAAQQYWSAISR
ncbi:MAG: hypothetical protein K5799_07925 [Erythrobacter sp.]|nr:hypothetical protein [Erythrobacter sp.]